MRPQINFLDISLIENIIYEAYILLKKIGIEVHNQKVVDLLLAEGAAFSQDKKRIKIPSQIIDRSISSVPVSFNLYNSDGEETHSFKDNNIYFTPGSTAINVLDYETGKIVSPTTKDYIEHVKIVDQLPYIEAQSTAIIPSDVPPQVQDSYRLYWSLLLSKKPVVTGSFTAENFEIMKDLQLIIRKTTQKLIEKPITIFSICPTSPLKWSPETSQNLIDCAKYKIPVEFISMPLSGFMAPVTLVGTLIQHTAETLSGIVIGQLANPGTPMLYGGSPAIFDYRYETTPMGAIETMMIDCAYSEIGKYLQIPTQAYIGFSDSKQLDAQSGLESGIGSVLAALSGINSISGPGMLNFESCQSLEKLILDNEICGMAKRLISPIIPKNDFPSSPLIRELINEQHLMISEHTLKYREEEHFVPGPIIDRKNLGRWLKDGEQNLNERSHREVKKLLLSYQQNDMEKEIVNDLSERMNFEMKKYNISIPNLF